MNRNRNHDPSEHESEQASVPAMFGGLSAGDAPPSEDDLDIDVVGDDVGDAARYAAGADPATRDRFDTAESNPNVISPPD
jgi:hypothetical protein